MPEPQNVFHHLSSSFEILKGKAAFAPDVANIFMPDELSPCTTLHRDAHNSNGSVSTVSRMFADEELFHYPPLPTEDPPRPRRSTMVNASTSPRMPHQHRTTVSESNSRPLKALEQPQPPLAPALDFARSEKRSTSSGAVVSKHAATPTLTYAQEKQFAAAVESGHLLTPPDSEEPAETSGSLFEPWETAPPPYALQRRTSSMGTN
ncbi:hypothetical protein HDU88_002012 [Geranomyces variabilis]|nr:hypothetical protein HDU88_002012 [Geranomyces variabilis]